MKFQFKYLVVKWDDLAQGLSDGEQKTFAKLIKKIDQFRVSQGKERTKERLVVNCEEPYAINVALLMAAHGHCEDDSQTDTIEIVW